jgi:hypothetical protein
MTKVVSKVPIVGKPVAGLLGADKGGGGAAPTPTEDKAVKDEAKAKQLELQEATLLQRAQAAGAIRGDNEADVLQFRAPTARRKNVARTVLG